MDTPMKKICEFKFTDGRPWYKQVVSGIFLFITLAFYFAAVTGVALLIYVMWLYVGGTAALLSKAAIVLGLIIAFIVLLFLSGCIYNWAKNE